MRWVSLHTHTTHSYGDAYGPVPTHVNRVGELGMNAVAFTEHGNVSSHVQLEKATNAYNKLHEDPDFEPKHSRQVKPIYGCEIYAAPPGSKRKNHQILLAMNEVGYQNLNRIVTRSWKKNEETKSGFYMFPTVHWKDLEEFNEGLIVTSGCADSLLSCTLLGGKNHGEKRLEYTDDHFRAAHRIIERYQEVFGDRYYIEVQRFPGLLRACALNPAFAKLADSTGAKLVGTADVHYPYPEDNEMQRILHAAHRGGTVESVDAEWEYDIRLTYPLTDGEIVRDLLGTGLTLDQAKEAVLGSERIAARCNVVLPKNEPIKFPIPSNYKTEAEFFRFKLNEGWRFRKTTNKRMQTNLKEYKDRIEWEITQIEGRGFFSYFLMLADAVGWAKDNKIAVGPARGSAAASLIAYILRITEVDPMGFPNMRFDRFISPTRLELPDVDLDFADDRRDEVRQYLARKYGADNVGNIGNYTKYKGKNSIDDVARVYGIPKWETEKIKSRIMERSGGDSRTDESLADTFDMYPEAHKVLEDFPELGYAMRLEGNYRGLGVHAAGLVISNAPITDTCAMYQKESNGRRIDVLPYDKKDSEYIGMLKADFLGLSTMGAIGIALDIIGMDLEDLYRVPLDDGPTMEAFRNNDVVGIFQFEGRATRLVCGQVKPDNFQELADINALSRPGPLFSGMTAEYIKVKHGEKLQEEYHPIVTKITDFTKGQIIYQEQILSTIQDVGGFPAGKIHELRKIISQKLGQMNFEAMYQQFADGAYELHGIDPKLARRIWDFMVTSATYAFCVTGDTLLERSGKGGNCEDEFVTVEDLYRQFNDRSNIPMSDKLRAGKLKILCMDDDGRIRPNNLIKIHDPLLKPCIKITTESGRSVTFSDEHRLMTADGYKYATDIVVGDMAIISLGKEGREQERRTSQNKSTIPFANKYLYPAQKVAWRRSGGECEHCGKIGQQLGHELEYAHVLTLTDHNGDYSKYHSADNLLVLCNSCHKKFDYRVQGTRNKRWTVGRPTGFDRIIGVESVGEQLVYDISMAGPSHNYQGNDFIHHNNVAHSISYSMLAFWAMWIKVNHPVAFYAAQLNKSAEEKWPTLMKDAVRHGVQILPPDLVKSSKRWEADVENSAVLAGFTQIPGIGSKTADNIIDAKNGVICAGCAHGPHGDIPCDVEYSWGSTTRQCKCLYNIDVDFSEGWIELGKVHKIGQKTLERIQEFCEQDDPFQLKTTKRVLDKIRQAIFQGNGDWALVSMPTHRSDDLKGYGGDVVWTGRVKKKEYKDYLEDERARTGKTEDEIKEDMKDPDLVKSCTLHCYDDGDEDVYVRFNRWQFPKFVKELDELNPATDVVVVKGRKHQDSFGNSIQGYDLTTINVSKLLKE